MAKTRIVSRRALVSSAERVAPYRTLCSDECELVEGKNDRDANSPTRTSSEHEGQVATSSPLPSWARVISKRSPQGHGKWKTCTRVGQQLRTRCVEGCPHLLVVVPGKVFDLELVVYVANRPSASALSDRVKRGAQYDTIALPVSRTFGCGDFGCCQTFGWSGDRLCGDRKSVV